MSKIGSGGVKASAGALGMGSEPEQGVSGMVRWDERLEQRTRDTVMRACVGLAVLLSTSLLISAWFIIKGVTS